MLQDLQPYVCTYEKCDVSEQLFRSRRDWIEHESSHRKVWRCPEHLDAVYKSQTGLEEHFKQDHEESISEGQLATIVKVGETSTIDQREQCPICLVSVDAEGLGTLQNHIANHLERIASFSLPIEVDDDSEGGSSQASRGGAASSGLPTTDESSERYDTSDFGGVDSDTEENIGYNPTTGDDDPQLLHSGDRYNDDASSRNDLSEPQASQMSNRQEPLSEALIKALPDGSGERINLLLSADNEEQTNSDELQEHDSSAVAEVDVEEHMAQRESFRKYLLSLAGAQSVRFYRRYGSWDGNINFTNGESAAAALRSFDVARYPNIKVRLKDMNKEVLKFSTLQHRSTKQVSFRSEVAEEDWDSLRVASPEHELPSKIDAGSSLPLRSVDNIPNIGALYRSKELLPRKDPSYLPNNAYNGIISFIFYDITRLKVDAIGMYPVT